ncbi:hypothetical protein SLS56_003147 [Neofusicoccum ribis]|uniref:Nephrocystin 3-like N-terminal domain-containing protein n=1 Tax=Neofusicoccum ribis TaxID=45134 RepID=A0ABR3T1W1_9PEZI
MGFPAHFNQLIEAYKKIGNSLPRFDRLANKFRNDPDVQNALAIFYADVLEFHRRVYILVKKRARFKGILDDIATHADLVDREVASTTFVEARELREAWLERTETQEKDRTSSQTRDVFAWLNVLKSEYEQEEELYNLSSRCHEHSCDWIFKNPKVLTWKQQGPTNGVIWLKGKPGSGE